MRNTNLNANEPDDRGDDIDALLGAINALTEQLIQRLKRRRPKVSMRPSVILPDKEVARLLGRSEFTVRDYWRRGRTLSLRIGRDPFAEGRIPIQSVMAYDAKLLVPPKQGERPAESGHVLPQSFQLIVSMGISISDSKAKG